MSQEKFETIFGPVNSRRLGLSLGIDLVPKKICTLDCIYCEVRETEFLTIERRPYIKADVCIRELERFFANHPYQQLDYITFAGQGEPTLNSEIGTVIKHIKNNYPFPVCVLTNGTLLSKKEVRLDLKQVDLVIPSLDAVTDKVFQKINRPQHSIEVNHIIDGIKQFRRDCHAKIWIEILFVKGINDSSEELTLLKDKINEIFPDKVYINTIYRPPAVEGYLPVDDVDLDNIKQEFDLLLGKRICKTHNKSFSKKQPARKIKEEDLVEQIKPMLNIRPCTLEDIHKVFNSYDSSLEKENLRKALKKLVDQQILQIKNFDQSQFYCLY